MRRLIQTRARLTGHEAPERGRRGGLLALGLLSTGQFIVSFDLAAVNVALPSIGRDLDLSRSGLQWPVTALALTFGGFLLAGGRAADVYGRRRVYVSGLAIISICSVVGALATDQWLLIAARAAQGVGAAFVIPSGLSLITTRAPEGAEREHALGVYGAMLSAGFFSGVILGGTLSTLLSWRIVLLVNALVGMLVIITVPVVNQRTRERRSALNPVTAALATAVVLALLLGLTRLGADQWLEGASWLCAATGLAALFGAAEARSSAPMIPVRLLRTPGVVAGSVAGLTTVGTAAGAMVLLTLYLQQVLHYTPFRAGLAFGLVGIGAVVAGALSSYIVQSVGALRALLAGVLSQALAIALLMLVTASGDSRLLGPTSIMLGFGNVLAIVGLTVIGTSGVHQRDQGLVGGMLNSMQQVGQALVVTLVVAALNRRAESVDPDSPRAGEGLIAGIHDAFLLTAGIAVLGLFLSLCLMRLTGRSPTAAAARQAAVSSVAEVGDLESQRRRRPSIRYGSGAPRDRQMR